MKKGILISLLALSLANATIPLAVAASDSPQDYALLLPLIPQGPTSLQRVTLQGQVMAALRSNSINDVRVFNQAGQAVAIAQSNDHNTAPVERRSVTLKSLPLAAGSPAPQDGMTVRIVGQGDRRLVEVSTTTGAQSPVPATGALFDSSTVNGDVMGARLNVVLPDARPVTLSIASSRDLTNWTPLASTVLYRSDNGTSRLGSDHMSWPAINLAGRFLLLSWQDADGNPVPNVQVQNIMLDIAKAELQPKRVSVAIHGVTLNDAHTVMFTLPHSTSPTAIAFAPGSDTLVMPIRVYSRNDRSQPWTLLSSGVIYHLTGQTGNQASSVLSLPGTPLREMKIEADAKTAGFNTIPAISFEYDPIQVIFLSANSNPLTLAAGNSNPTSTYLPLHSLIPGYRSGQENLLPQARIDTGNAAAVIQVVTASDSAPRKNIVLWVVLLAGVLLLSSLVWLLTRQPKASAM